MIEKDINQKTLKMKYSKVGFGIIMEHPDTDYLIRANILKIKDENYVYDVTLEIKRADTGYWDTLDEEHYTLKSPQINSLVYDFVMAKARMGFFDYFIKRYEYELSTFDLGNEVREMSKSQAILRGGDFQ